MALNTCGAAWQRKSESEETESQDCTVGTDTHMQEARELTASLTPSAEWGEADDDDERLLDAEFAAKEKELEHYAGLAQKQLDRHIQKV